MSNRPYRQQFYMISVAAEKANMHPQTLRIYEARGLIQPQRTGGNTRLYSQNDVDLLLKIQKLTTEMGMNLAGVERVLRLETELQKAKQKIRELEEEKKKR